MVASDGGTRSSCAGAAIEVLGLGHPARAPLGALLRDDQASSVAVAILLVYTAPIFLAVLAPLFLPERRSRVGSLALAISAPGIALIALGGEEGSQRFRRSPSPRGSGPRSPTPS